MFSNASAFDGNIVSWDTGKVTHMTLMLRGTSFDRNIAAWDVTALTAAGNFLLSVTLSTANYDALLIGWEGQAVNDTVTFHGGSSTYTGGGAAATARAALVSDHSWAITDGGTA